MYVMPATGVGAAAGPRQGIANSDSELQPVRGNPKTEPAVKKLAALIKRRLSTKVLPELFSLATVSLLFLEGPVALAADMGLSRCFLDFGESRRRIACPCRNSNRDARLYVQVFNRAMSSNCAVIHRTVTRGGRGR